MLAKYDRVCACVLLVTISHGFKNVILNQPNEI